MSGEALSDRELLERAARAAGMWVLGERWPSDHKGGWFYNEHSHGGGMFQSGGSKRWNPLTDDGDALRLAVKLDLIVGAKSMLNKSYAHSADEAVRESHSGSDPYAATRRAIVRCAASLPPPGGES